MAWDVAVIGGGAAGMMAAWASARAGARTVLLEKTDRLGTKIRISGGGRCNITNALTDPRDWERHFPGNGKFLAQALRKHPPSEILDLLHAEGVRTVVEAPYGKIFPQSGKSGDVIDAMIRAMKREGVEIRTGVPVRDLVRREGVLAGITTGRGAPIEAKTVVWCTGGRSFPKSGSTGDGYPVMRRAGHKVEPTWPSLVPLRVAGTTAYSGVALRGVRGQARVAGAPVGMPWNGDVLWTHFGLSGPVILQLSRFVVAGWVEDRESWLELDLMPDETREDLDRRLLETVRSRGGATLRSLLPEVVPRNLVPLFFGTLGLDPERRLAEVTRNERRTFVDGLKAWKWRPEGWHSMEAAEVTAGGVSVDEVNPKTMASRIVDGLYLAGEILDVDGFVGGFNLQAAWSTGALAGSSAARKALGSATIR